MSWQVFIYDFITYAIFTYSVTLLLFYILIAVYSTGDARHYINKNSFTDYRTLVSSPHVPSLSILAPAYNEGATIIENVRSLLSIYYSNLEVVIINDGSKDDTMAKLIKAYDLKKIDYFVRYQISTKEVRGIYKSSNPVYKKLVVVDKMNGGKADALNVGVNIASNDYIVCIDVDCVLEQDALLKLTKPFIEETKVKVIATGGVVRIANSCVIEHGKLLKVRLPEQYLPRMQVLEYIRAFLLGRMAWSRLNGLLLISGAFGAFDKEIVIKCGGYNHNTVGEDMELVVRMRRYMEERNEPYKVAFIPDPLCWTEAPASYKILGRQRNRWTRGTIETLQIHKKMFFNPKYGILGMLSYPYWFFFEMCAPAIEFLGFIALLVMSFFGVIDWSTFFLFLAFIISFGYTYSAFAVLMEVLTYNQYKRRTDVMKLLLTGLTEPFRFHPFVVWHGVMGYIDLLRKKKSWGEMTRQGFGATPAQPQASPTVTEALPEVTQKQAKQTITPVAIQSTTVAASHTEETVRPGFIEKIIGAARSFIAHFIPLSILFLLVRTAEIIINIKLHEAPASVTEVVLLSMVKDVSFVLSYGISLFFPFCLLYLLSKRIASIFFIVVGTIAVVVQAGLVFYFISTLVPLGSDVWAYSWKDINQTIGASGALNVWTVLCSLLMIAFIAFAIGFVSKKIKPARVFSLTVLLILAIGFTFGFARATNSLMTQQEYSNNLTTNKSYFFYTQSFRHFFPTNDYDIYDDGFSGELEENTAIAKFNYVNESEYPFLHTVDTTIDVLSPFFNTAATKPNIIFLVVEGLGRAFTNEGAYLGNFTPYIDSLSSKSLYWENFLSASGRTFGMLPSLTASLPYGQSGFTELKDQMPPHQSLMSILRTQGYNSSFYYGGDASFDFMNLFLQRNGVSVNDEKSFPSGYQKMPQSSLGFTWGYGDKELMRRYLSAQQKAPFCDIILTVSTHSPFLINNMDEYNRRFEQRMRQLKFTPEQMDAAKRYKAQYASVLFADDAVRDLIEGYRSKPEFANTVFIITGDHRMPEIPMATRLDRYHVPFIIYSPLLKRTAQFSSISTHLDVVPTLLNWLKNYGVKPPAVASWMGSGIDTAQNFRNIHAYPFIQTKLETVDFMMGNYWLSGEQLYSIQPNMDMKMENDSKKQAQLKAAFDQFKSKNAKVNGSLKLVPDSTTIK